MSAGSSSTTRACAPDLHPTAMGIIDQEDVGLRILREVALRDVAGCRVIANASVFLSRIRMKPSARAMLDIGLAVRAGGRQEHAVLRGEKRREILVDIAAPAAALLDLGIGVARSLASLDGFTAGVNATSLEKA